MSDSELLLVQQGGLGIDLRHRNSLDHGAAFVAKDMRLTVAYLDHQAATAINIGDLLVRDNRQLVEV